jgi:hypothetical protein
MNMPERCRYKAAAAVFLLGATGAFAAACLADEKSVAGIPAGRRFGIARLSAV